MKILSLLMLMLVAAAGLFAITQPSLGTYLLLGITVGIFIVAGVAKAFGNH